ncbi:MAG TPA: putative Ig domain-containing protein, partial [Acidimicrobiales bacterium]|nr:putative Ig domain-containing protein [Acidimicrobiales bacterium]
PVEHPAATSPQVVTGGPQPCSKAKSTAQSQGSYTADEIASAYRYSTDYKAGDLGAGITVALFELEPNSTSDISAYQSCYKTSATVKYLKEDGGAGSGHGEGEAALDIEDVIGLAPDATIDVYQAPNTDTGLIDDYTAIVDNDSAQVVSTSWGLCETESSASIISQEATLFQQAAAQGQSVFAAAGDDGSEDCGTSALSVDDPASQPYVTGVGGTSLTKLGPPPTETTWNDSSVETGAGGGGISADHTMPSYQADAAASLHVINSHSSGTPCGAASGTYCREVPDVSADADPYTGYVIYWDGGWTSIGGTSAAAPTWASFAALTDASSACSGARIGFANPTLYQAGSDYSADFQDVTSGNNDYTPTGYKGGLYPAASGYDMASGLGSPDAANLGPALCRVAAAGQVVSVTDPGDRTSESGTTVDLPIQARDTDGYTMTYAATGLPAGLSINSVTGVISGKPTTAGRKTVTVTVTDSQGNRGAASFDWTVTAPPACPPAQLLSNGGFESGFKDWTSTAGVILDNSKAGHAERAEAGQWFAWLGRSSGDRAYRLWQHVTLPAHCHAYTLTYDQHIDTTVHGKATVDTLKLQVLNDSGKVLGTLRTTTNADAGKGYYKHSYSLARWAGQKITLRWYADETKAGNGTHFCVDSASINVS